MTIAKPTSTLPAFLLNQLPTVEIGDIQSLDSWDLLQPTGWKQHPDDKMPRLKLHANPNWQIKLGDLVSYDFQVMALRGFLVRYDVGYMLYDGAEQKVACSSVGAAPYGLPEIHHPAPMKRIIWHEKVGQEGIPSPALQKANPIGSREQTCTECVRAGRHRLENDKGRCGAIPRIVFAVTHLGRLTRVRAQNTTAINWVPLWTIPELGTETGEEFVPAFPTVPLLIQGTISSSTARPVPELVRFKDQRHGIPLPSDYLRTIEPFLDYLHDKKDRRFAGAMTLPGTSLSLPAYPQMVDIWAGVPTDDSKSQYKGQIQCVPLFRVTPPEEVETLGIDADSVWNTVVHQYSSWFLEHGGLDYEMPTKRMPDLNGLILYETAPLTGVSNPVSELSLSPSSSDRLEMQQPLDISVPAQVVTEEEEQSLFGSVLSNSIFNTSVDSGDGDDDDDDASGLFSS